MRRVRAPGRTLAARRRRARRIRVRGELRARSSSAGNSAGARGAVGRVAGRTPAAVGSADCVGADRGWIGRDVAGRGDARGALGCAGGGVACGMGRVLGAAIGNRGWLVVGAWTVRWFIERRRLAMSMRDSFDLIPKPAVYIAGTLAAGFAAVFLGLVFIGHLRVPEMLMLGLAGTFG